MSNDLPYKTEYATTSRASCRKCKQKIDKGVLRVAEMVYCRYGDEKRPDWYHSKCFFQKYDLSSISEIAGFNKLKNIDQQNIRSLVEGEEETNIISGQIVKRETKSREQQEPMECKIPHKKMRKEPLETNQGTSSNLKEEVGAMEVDSVGVSEREDMKKKIKLEEIQSTANLQDEEMIVKQEDTIKTSGENGEMIDYGLKDKEEVMKEQNDLFHKYRDALDGLANINQILKRNGQNITNYFLRKDHLADCMVFGALEACPKCGGQLVLDTFYYKCTGASAWGSCVVRSARPLRRPLAVPEGFLHKAPFTDYSPKVDVRLFRSPSPTKPQPLKNLVFFIYKDEIGDVINEDETNKTNDDSGVLQQIDETHDNDESNVSMNNDKMNGSVNHDDKNVLVNNDDTNVLENNDNTNISINNDDTNVAVNNDDMNDSGNHDNMNVTGNNDDRNVSVNSKTHDALNIVSRITQLGGKVSDGLKPVLAAVVWLGDKKQLEKTSTATLERIAELDIQIVHKSFFDHIDINSSTVEHTLRLISEGNIAHWGSDPATRLGIEYSSTSPWLPSEVKLGPVKYQSKGGVVLDPHCPLEAAHVVTAASGAAYSAVLTRTDVASGRNSYYRMQLLQADTHKQYWVFFAWGRIATNQGKTQLLKFKTRKEAKDKFFGKFKQKTKNKWKNRANFVMHPNCYYLQDLEYHHHHHNIRPALGDMEISENAALPPSVQRLVKKIFDIEEMQRTLVEFEIDTAKMPLGKITRKQLCAAYSVLCELAELVSSASPDEGAIAAASNRFYALVPRSFGRHAAPALASKKHIICARELLDQLMEIQLTYTMLPSDAKTIEEYYQALRSDIVPLTRTSADYQLLAEYVKNTHATTHDFSVHILKAFKVTRKGERSRYENYSNLHNRRLLWHGSRLTNFAGILSQGLRIAPAEAPATGYMFGKGIYFADLVTKSAQYCAAHASRPEGLMLLCEVALGNMKECLNAEYVTRLPPNKHSVLGVGKTHPDPRCTRVLENGTLVPLGAPVLSDRLCELLYNEYVVYNVAQVNVKYLLHMKFDFKLKI